MKMIKTTIGLLCLSFSLFAFQINTDSLVTELSNKDGQEQLPILYDLVTFYIENDTALAQKYINEFSDLADNSKDKKTEAKLLYLKGRLAYYQSRYIEAKPLIEKSLGKYRVLYDLKGESEALNILGLVYRNMSMPDEAKKYHQLSIDICNKENDLDGLARAYTNIAAVEEIIGNYTSAIDYGYKAKSLCEKLNDIPCLANTYTNLAIVYYQQSNISDAINYKKKAIKLHKRTENKMQTLRNIANLGAFYSSIDSNLIAVKYYEEALKMSKEMGNKKQEANQIMSIGGVFHFTKDYEKALIYYKRAIKIYESINDTNSAITSNLNIGALLCEQKLLSEGIPYLEKALDLSKKAKEVRKTIRANDYLARANFFAGNFEKAYLLNDDYHQLKDSIFNVEKTKAIEEIEEKYENEKLTKENAEQELDLAKKDAQLRISIGSLIATVVGLVLLAFMFRERNTKLCLLEDKETELYGRNQELIQELEKAKEQNNKSSNFQNRSIQLTNHSKTIIPLKDILYVKSEGNGIRIITTSEKHWVWQALKNFKAMLPETMFSQIHKSYLINLDHVTNYTAQQCVLTNGDALKVTRTYSKQLRAELDQRTALQD